MVSDFCLWFDRFLLRKCHNVPSIISANHTLAYIEHMTKEEICERRLMAYDFFHNYVVSGEARLRAIVEIMDERLRTGRIEPFQYAPGISSHPASRATYVPRE